ncbi:oxidoreductase [Rhypophila sp. PSN 637]
MTSRPWIFLCPSSRGIGHALTRHLLQNTHPSIPIFATARGDLSSVKSSILKDLPLPSNQQQQQQQAQDLEKRLHLVSLDVTSESSVQSASEHASSLFPKQTHHLHLAFALPGILYPEKSYTAINYGNTLETYKVNVLGPILLMKYFADFMPRKSTIFATTVEDGTEVITSLPPSATWTTMSARVGSVSDNHLGGWYSYRSSKAAVNSLTKSLDHELRAKRDSKAMAVAYHPGTVKTGLSREFWGSVANDSLFTPEDAASKMAGVIFGLRDGQRGRCWDWKGSEIHP